MKQFFKIVFVYFILLSNVIKADTHSDYLSNQIIVKFRVESNLLKKVRNITPKSIAEKFETKDIQIKDKTLLQFINNFKIKSIQALKPSATLAVLPGGIERIFILELNSNANTGEIIKLLSKESYIEYAEYDFNMNILGQDNGMIVNQTNSVVPNDPEFWQEWGLQNTGQEIQGVKGTPGADINMTNAWTITKGDTSVKVAILDSGIPMNASELKGRIVPGYDIINNDNDPSDDYGHGSNIAGIISANGNNGSLMAGIDWKCKIMPIKVTNSRGRSQYSIVGKGIIMAVDSGAQVINISLAGPRDAYFLRDAVTYAKSFDRIIVTGMGNSNDETTYYPAAYEGVIAVGATNSLDQRANPFFWGGGSSYGSHIDFAVPGEYILGLWYPNPNLVSLYSGTSQSAAVMSGVIALMFSLDETVTFERIYNAFRHTSEDQVGLPEEDIPGFDKYYGWGRIDAYKAFDEILRGSYRTSSQQNRLNSNSLPNEFSLKQNYPNPFNPTTNIKFNVPINENVSLKIYDINGKEILTLVNEFLTSGEHEIKFDGNNITSGIYYYTLEVGNFKETRKMLLIK